MICAEPAIDPLRTRFAASDYDLAATLTSGQAFRWQPVANSWEGVVGHYWIRLTPGLDGVEAQTAIPVCDWEWLIHYLQLEVNLASVLATFPKDAPLQTAVRASRGLRLLRQDPWECLASFILSSTKQIVQIQQIVRLLCERHGDPVAVPEGHAPAFTFPAASRIAACTEAELRRCKMGFRAPYLRQTATLLCRGEIELERLRGESIEAARAALMDLPGVGRKIADCVLLFAYGFQQAFPIDVWVMKALRELYFPGRRLTTRRLREFSDTHFGPYAGYAQQYLFHNIRSQRRPRRPAA